MWYVYNKNKLFLLNHQYSYQVLTLCQNLVMECWLSCHQYILLSSYHMMRVGVWITGWITTTSTSYWVLIIWWESVYGLLTGLQSPVHPTEFSSYDETWCMDYWLNYNHQYILLSSHHMMRLGVWITGWILLLSLSRIWRVCHQYPPILAIVRCRTWLYTRYWGGFRCRCEYIYIHSLTWHIHCVYARVLGHSVSKVKGPDLATNATGH
jgi:hypothetical protein